MVDDLEPIGDDALSRLVDQARGEDPPPEAMERMAAKLMPPATGVAPAPKSPGLWGLKGLGTLGVIAVAGGVAWWSSQDVSPSAPTLVALAVQPVEARTVTPAQPSAAPPVPSTAPPDPKPVVSVRQAPSPAPAAPSAEPLDQAKMLELARRKLASDPAGALALAEKARTVKGGNLGAEAEIIAIEALVRSGRASDARSRAQRMLTRSPNTPYKRRLRDILGEPMSAAEKKIKNSPGDSNQRSNSPRAGD